MKKKKAFTLVELLAVIIILAIILLIAVPNVMKIIEKTKNDSYAKNIELIKKGSMTYLTSNIDKIYFDKNNMAVITLEDLIEDKVFTEIKDPRCNKNFIANDTKIIITKENDLLNYQVIPITMCQEGLYKEEILNGADPILDREMIPIKREGNTWKVADTMEKWYSYTDKKWANAVTVTEESRVKYSNGDGTYKDNVLIEESDVLTYLVWIPRYKYAIPTGVGARTINIIFENKNTFKSLGSAVDIDYYTHPAFTFGDTELNGYWVGKYDTTGTKDNPTSLPNNVSLRNQKMKEQFDTSQKITSVGNNYGLNSYKLDSHLIKNSEWGAITYLSHSKYGIDSEVRKNNSNTYITGCGANEQDGKAVDGCENAYDTSIGVLASTTGNIYGIYDMNGAGFKYVMGYLTSANPNYVGDPNSYFGWGSIKNSSGFTSKVDDKYFDSYSNVDLKLACNNTVCKGHSLSETSGWYGDASWSLSTTSPFFVRGGGMGYNDNTSGIFRTSSGSGVDTSIYSFRFIISNK